MIQRGLLIGLAVTGVVSLAGAQTPATPDSVLQGRPDLEVKALPLDPAFMSSVAGISVRPPAGGKMIRRSGGGDEIVRYVNDELKWQFVVSRFQLSEPMPLITKNAEAAKTNPKLVGFVDSVLGQLPAGVSVRNELVPISGYEGALLATFVPATDGGKLIQHAIVRKSDKAFYVVTLTLPVKTGDPLTDVAARVAIETFDKIGDSIELLDQEQIARDQTERLLRTRALMVNWSRAKLESAIVEEQWLRLIKDGKDVGYSYVVEEVASDLPRAGKAKGDAAVNEKSVGVRVGVRSRTVPSPTEVIDVESWSWVSADRNQEAFSNLVLTTEAAKPQAFSQVLGSVIRQDRFVPGRLETPDERGNMVGPVKNDRYEMNVWEYFSRSNGNMLPPTTRELPPFYLPQATGQLLPRLLPLNTPTTYLWASYVPENRGVMMRYVDVQPATTVSLGGATFTAVPVQERMGFEGSITTHYVTPDGIYRGSVNEENKISIIPSDAATIRSIWKDANLARPADVEETTKK